MFIYLYSYPHTYLDLAKYNCSINYSCLLLLIFNQLLLFNLQTITSFFTPRVFTYIFSFPGKCFITSSPLSNFMLIKVLLSKHFFISVIHNLVCNQAYLWSFIKIQVSRFYLEILTQNAWVFTFQNTKDSPDMFG